MCYCPCSDMGVGSRDAQRALARPVHEVQPFFPLLPVLMSSPQLLRWPLRGGIGARLGERNRAFAPEMFHRVSV